MAERYDDGYVSIPKSVYLGLLESERLLAALEAAGVDNWEGYSAAYRILEGEEEW